MHKTTEVSIFDSSTLDFNVSEYFSMGYTYIAMYLEEIIEELISFILLQIQKSIFHSL